MNASRSRSSRRNAFLSAIFILPALLFPARVCLGQADTPGAANRYVVSVQDLKMAGKSHAAFDKGSRLLEKGDALGSIAYFEQAVSEYPEHYKAYYDLGVAHFRLAQQSEAEQAFQKAIDITKGGFAPPQFGLAAILCQKAEFSQAAALLQRALDLDPGSAIGKYYLAWAQFGLNRMAEAERSLEQALLRNAHLGEAYLLLARVHQREKNLPAAFNDLESYLKLEPRKEQARLLAGQIRRELGQESAVVASIRP